MFNIFNLFSKKNIWDRLKRSKGENGEAIFALAPMLDVTDKPFRQIISELGAPDIFFTEFVSVDGIASKEGRKHLLKMLEKTEYEKKHHNLIFQIFGSDPQKFKEAIKIIKKLKPAGIDINTGCPVKAIIKQNAGSALMKNENRKLMEEIFLVSRKACRNTPLSIKTRIGFYDVDLDWIKFLLKLKPDALTIHFRTMKEMSKVPAHWDLALKIVDLKNEISPNTFLIGNGDIDSFEDGKQKIKEINLDAVMVGRGIFNNPKIFVNEKWTETVFKEKKNILLKHLELFHNEYYLGNNRYLKNFSLMKKFFKIYINGFDGAKELRIELMQAKNLKEVNEKIKNINF